jgi:Mg-chelatase subunit ChlD
MILKQRILDDFQNTEDGNVTIFSVFMVVIILTITGASVDLMRLESTRVSMQSTMDRAVLAAADLDQKQDPELVVQDYLNKAGMGSALSNASVSSALNARTVSANGSIDMDTIFMHMSGFDTLTAPALSTADERIANVEISLVLDISGSMRYNNRMNQMRPAAQHFVSKVMSNDSNGVTTLNLIPFAGHVNPGDTLFDYFRGERPKIKKGNNGWGNGDQDAPGNSLCNNNAENAVEGATDPSCNDGTTTDTTGTTEPDPTPVVEDYFPEWNQDIDNVVFYFDTDGDDVYDRAHMIEDFPGSASRDADDFFKGAAAYLLSRDNRLSNPSQFLGVSIKGGNNRSIRYFQVKGDQNGQESDIGPTKHSKKRLPGDVFDYDHIDFDYWATQYVSPTPVEEPEPAPEPAPEPTSPGNSGQNVNMPSSCVEIYDDEFLTTALPKSEDYVPHFMFWDIAADVMEWGWCPGEDAAVQYYSADAQHLVDFIGDMPMYDGTGLPYGMKYALSLLDPDNRDEVSYLITEGLVDARFQGRPIDWNDPETEKYIVVMTDGQTTDQYRPNDPTAEINNTVELNNQGSSSYNKLSSQSKNVSNLMLQCDLAKQLGVTVFTIAFETNSAATADMRECASSVSHFFHVQGNEIADAFDMVARQINNLRLIQ